MRRSANVILLFLVALVAIASCAEENAPPWFGLAPTTSAVTTAIDASVPAPGARVCNQAQAQAYPQRLVATSTTASSGLNTILVSDLYNQFQSVCGGCHGVAAADPMGGFGIYQESTFDELMTPAVIAHVTHAVCPQAENPNNPYDPMPPCDSPTGQTYASRSTTNDPVYLLAQAVTEWLADGKPSSFVPGGASAAEAGTTPSSYALTPQNGDAMTNIGNCIPSPSLTWLQGEKISAMDAMFAALRPEPNGTTAQQIGLPEHLSETDLFTLDSATLAQYGVLAYAPGYPLWTDNAGKLRYVRVPMGQSIHFDKATQRFQIPPNTRFYKTFMKEIIDTDGSYRYRKIETRMIVSRPDVNNPDGTAAAQTALFGTYKWRDDESEADLIETPLISGQPFADTLLIYNTNEPLAADVLQGQPAEPDLALVQAGAARHYAIPSSARCVQCHMGSESQSFILGFMPLQIARYATGTHGVIEPAGPDELTQLQRLIDAGVISGIESPDDVLPLEQSQGTRTPRNYLELTAQGYMLGNCSHCHNPRGLPTVQNPVLAGVLDFLPSAEGGVFQFPLERYSPRIGRGPSGTTPIPYVTPSLVDLPRVSAYTGQPAGDIFVTGSGATGGAHSVIYAPWRSIIYRNVDAAFAYVDDLAIYPHMPMNSPGYDPRAKDILGDWMVSIPAVRKQPNLVEYAYQTNNQLEDNIPPNAMTDTSPQPYVEVTPGSPGYEAAQLAAEDRLAILHTGTDVLGNTPVQMASGSINYIRYTDPGQTEDILDPAVLENPICTPVPQGDPAVYTYPFPEHPHWVNTDLSNPPGPWTPRQTNWSNVLVHDDVPPLGVTCAVPAALASAYNDQLSAVSTLPNVRLEDVDDFTTTPRPFGLWQQQAGCDFSSQQTVQDFSGALQPHWMTVGDPPPAPTAPVYMETPGEAVFKMICINCHGPTGSANGRLALNLATMTGGTALVADFHDGLFGPAGSAEPASNRHAQFGVSNLPSDTASNPDWAADWIGSASDPITDDDRASRYMAWMGLGGTNVNIPLELLQIVAVTKVLDQQRVLPSSSLSANMLSETKALCLSLLGPGIQEVSKGTPHLNPGLGHGYLDAKVSDMNLTLIPSNGDAELWLGLCSRGNPSPVHILTMLPGQTGLTAQDIDDTSGNLAIDSNAFSAMVTKDVYPAGAPVGNERGGVDSSLCVDAQTCCPDSPASCALCSLPGQGSLPGQAPCVVPNEWPWCVDPTSIVTPAQIAWAQSNNLPQCPQSVITFANACNPITGTPANGCVTTAYGNAWAVHGAINAGFSVFRYLESIEIPGPPPDYDQCTLLGSASAGGDGGASP